MQPRRIIPKPQNRNILHGKGKKRYSLTLLAGAALLVAGCGGGDDGDPTPRAADLILKNATVYTVDPSLPLAQAVAIRDGKILYVGDDAGTTKLKGSHTQEIDMQRKMVIPGFVDPHNHAYLRAEGLFWVTLSGQNLNSYQQQIADYRRDHPGLAQSQVRGVGFNWGMVLRESAKLGKLPHQVLEEMVPGVPAVIITHGHHEIWVNTTAMALAGVTSHTPDPLGAYIDRDPTTGEPTGIFREFGAQNLIISKLPQPDFTVAEFQTSILSFQNDLAAQRGVTSVGVPLHYPSPNYLEAIQSVDRENELKVRYELRLWADENRGAEQVPELTAVRDRYQGAGMSNLNGIKIFTTGVDGSPEILWNQTVLNQTVAELDRKGFRIFIHNMAAPVTFDKVLDAYEYALKQNGARDSRHSITHVNWGTETPPMTTIERFKSLGVWADGHPPAKEFFDAGVKATLSSDYPVQDFHPLTRISRAVSNGISLEQAIASHTALAAQLIFHKDTAGYIAEGREADLVVLDKDLRGMTGPEILTAKVLMTVANGNIAFQDQTLGGPGQAINPQAPFF